MEPDGLISHLRDAAVDAELDAKLRHILNICFDPPPPAGQRFFNEMPSYRFFLDKGDHLAAHLAVHEKRLHVGDREKAFIGIAEVCVLPPYRGRGLVKRLLKEAEAQFPGVAYSMLLGDAEVYGSSGYTPVQNVIFPDVSPEPSLYVLVKLLGSETWPYEAVTIAGSTF